jgi:hypothetical protein
MVGCMDGMWGYVASSACVVVRESRQFASSRSASERERERERERAGGGRRSEEGRRSADGFARERSLQGTNTILTDFFLAVFGEFIWRLSGKKAFVEEEIRYASLSVFPLINPSLQEESSC